MTTSIEWASLDGTKPGHTVNPIKARDKRTGHVGHFCTRVSPGCANCFASAFQRRFKMHPFEPKYRNRITFFLDAKALESVTRHQSPTAYFWGSMTDLFGSWVRDSWLDAIHATIALTPQHLHLVLTKRPERARKYYDGLAELTHAQRAHRLVSSLPASMVRYLQARKDRPLYDHISVPFPIPRLMVGCSFENQATADERLPALLRTKAWQRFVSFEPALGAVTLKWAACTCADKKLAFQTRHERSCPLADHELCALLHRVIYGGESGADARPNYLQWCRSMIRQCDELRVPAYVKQLGAFPTTTPIGTVEFQKRPTRVIKLALTPAEGRKRPAAKGNKPEEWPEEYRVRQ